MRGIAKLCILGAALALVKRRRAIVVPGQHHGHSAGELFARVDESRVLWNRNRPRDK